MRQYFYEKENNRIKRDTYQFYLKNKYGGSKKNEWELVRFFDFFFTNSRKKSKKLIRFILNIAN
jgi:hypothetical protein